MPLPDGSIGIGYLGSGVVKISSNTDFFIKKETCKCKYNKVYILSFIVTSLLCLK